MYDKVGTKNWLSPLLLTPDNFTPRARTPWGGRKILDLLKTGLASDANAVVGESWELSVEPDFPSRVVDGRLLDAVIRADPKAWLGSAASPGQSTALLVKLLDAAHSLSVQIHPTDGDPALGPEESGKPEAWYVVNAEKEAGLYLGFRLGVGSNDVRNAIERREDLSKLLFFVPVRAGDTFAIMPGTPHAVGAGVMLLEPQRVAAGARGVTYRYWDWNRLYGPDGHPESDGTPRPLHLERALAVTDWDGPRESALLGQIRHRSELRPLHAEVALESLMGTDGPVRSEVFGVERLTGTGGFRLPATATLRSFTVLEGLVRFEGRDFPPFDVPRGQTAAVPAGLGETNLTLDAAHAVICQLV